MRGILRLIDGLINGDPEALVILVIAVIATAIIYFIAEMVQRRRKQH